MTPRLPTLKAREVLAALKKAGWAVHETVGSHHQLKHPDKPGKVTLPIHPGDFPRRLLFRVLRQAGITQDEFRKFL